MSFFFKQKTAYELRISDWSSDVCSSDLKRHCQFLAHDGHRHVDSGDASQYARQQIAAFEGCRVPAIRHLVVGGAVDIIENRTWEPASGQSAKVMKIVAIVQTHKSLSRSAL